MDSRAHRKNSFVASDSETVGFPMIATCIITANIIIFICVIISIVTDVIICHHFIGIDIIIKKQ